MFCDTSEFPLLGRKNSESLDAVTFEDKLFDSKFSEYFSADFAILNRYKAHVVSKHVNSARALESLLITA